MSLPRRRAYPTYQDFELEITRSGRRYMARVVSSPGGEATLTFTSPPKLVVDNLILRMRAVRQSTRRIDSPERAAARRFGELLFTRVFNNDVLRCFTTSLEKTAANDEGLRVRLRLRSAGDLINLPWEFLYNATREEFVALSPRTPIVRYLELSETIRPLATALPLDVLVVIAKPREEHDLNSEREFAVLKQAVAGEEAAGRIRLHRLERATLPEFRRALQRHKYDIVHFIGHGSYDAAISEGLLLFENTFEGREDVPASLLATLVAERGVRLIVLNTCEGARSGAADPFAGVAQSLIRCGVPAVVAMQFEITDEAAISFAQAFYESVADGLPLDAAMVDARQAILADNNPLEWATPVLYLRAADGHIFKILSAENSPLSDSERDNGSAEPFPRRVIPAASIPRNEVVPKRREERGESLATRIARFFMWRADRTGHSRASLYQSLAQLRDGVGLDDIAVEILIDPVDGSVAYSLKTTMRAYSDGCRLFRQSDRWDAPIVGMPSFEIVGVPEHCGAVSVGGPLFDNDCRSVAWDYMLENALQTGDEVEYAARYDVAPGAIDVRPGRSDSFAYSVDRYPVKSLTVVVRLKTSTAAVTLSNPVVYVAGVSDDAEFAEREGKRAMTTALPHGFSYHVDYPLTSARYAFTWTAASSGQLNNDSPAAAS